MVRPRNPFKPSAGSDPPLLVGRSGLLDEFAESIEDGPGAPGRATIYTGPRGIGKTVMLNAVGERAQADYQWRVIDETATPGLLDRLTARIRALAPPLPDAGRHLTGLSLAGAGFSTSDPAAVPELGFRDAVTWLLDELEQHGTGLLITVDEVHVAMRDEVRQFAAVIQHLVREDREIAVALAGIPSGVSGMLNDQVITFLRRAERHALGDVALADVRIALADTITTNGRTITDEALDAATAATGGYPFMIQLVGYHVWRRAGEDGVIDASVAESGIQAARARLGSLVHDTSMNDLSPVDRTFLLAMAHDHGPSGVETIGHRMGKSAGYVSVYRSRLIEAGLIAPAGRGRVDYALPFLREYLREHGAKYVMPEDDAGPEGGVPCT